jgi:tetratricopeptide (TPR) repeat protein
VKFLRTLTLVLCLSASAQQQRIATLEALLDQAHQAQTRSDYGAAADAYAKAVAIRPDLAELWSNLGLMQYQSHLYAEAERALRRAVGMNKSLFVPNLFLGLDLLELKRPRDAVPYLLAAETQNQQDLQALLALGRTFHVLSDWAHSRDWYQKAVDLAPLNGDPWFGLGLAYFGLAESASAKLTSAFAASPYVTQLTAEAFAEQGRLSEASRAYRALLASAEPPRCARTDYGLILLRQNERTQAEEQFERDRESCPAAMSQGKVDSPASAEHPLPRPVAASEKDLEQFASDAFFAGDFTGAAVAADQLRQEYPNHAEGWYWTVRAYQKLGAAALGRAGEVDPESPRIHALLGDAYQRRKMFREAQDEYSKMLALAPESIAALAGLADAYFADGQLELAAATAQKALGRDPADGEVNLLMGEILVAQHKYAESEPYLKRSLHVRPEMVARVHALLGRVFARTGRSQDAIRELTQGLASDEDGSVHYQLARLYQEAGNTKAAAAEFKKSEQIRAKRGLVAEEMVPAH